MCARLLRIIMGGSRTKGNKSTTWKVGEGKVLGPVGRQQGGYGEKRKGLQPNQVTPKGKSWRFRCRDSHGSLCPVRQTTEAGKTEDTEGNGNDPVGAAAIILKQKHDRLVRREGKPHLQGSAEFFTKPSGG